MTRLRRLLALAVFGFVATPAWAQISPDDVAGARRLLAQRARVPTSPVAELIRQHRYPEAEALLNQQVRAAPGDPQLLALRVQLLIQAWRLEQAMRVAQTLPNGKVLVGRIQLLQKKYDEALATAREAIAADPKDAEAYLLEADVQFWKEKPELAETPLERALELDPLNADARFAYGYAIWRRVDARQLPAMAAQWNLALEIDSLHYVTHWHFGNGHTHLTYADYAQPTDSAVRARLRGVDSLIEKGSITDALSRARQVEAEFPAALLPTMTRASIFYMATGIDRRARLDSAQSALLSLLRRKPNYGPAHNALAAVIKQRQFTYHAKYDSLEAEIARQPVPTDSNFYREFRNIRYYPGDRVIKMAVQQLGPAMAYIPFIARMGYSYVIPPLHHDLTHAMNQPFFRNSTTFDNRQWMDIRGSGGNHASAGIEYVERGSHQERVVLLHEYVHQFHGAVLTDQQNRRIRKLYHDAMAANRTLDYYAANNESEFFAQSYEAYLTPVKVHPLNHKAMNTRADLLARDPELFAFLDTLITENRAYLAGDRNAMRKNWAQVYVTLARQLRGSARGDAAQLQRALAMLDTAAQYSSDYVPAVIERAAVLQGQSRWQEAEAALDTATSLAPDYAPVFEARAQLLRARATASKRRPDVAQEIGLYRRALELEDDLSERADLNRMLRELYLDNAMYREALDVADSFVATAPTPSTYLRDRKDEAAAFVAEVRSSLGYDETAFFDGLLSRKPQHAGHRAQAVWSSAQAGNAARAVQLMRDIEPLMRATGQLPNNYRVLRTVFLDVDSADKRWLSDMVIGSGRQLTHNDRVRLATHLLHNGRARDALRLMTMDTATASPRQHADHLYIQAVAESLGGRNSAAAKLLNAALARNPHHVEARLLLATLFRTMGKVKEAEAVAVAEIGGVRFGEVYTSRLPRAEPVPRP